MREEISFKSDGLACHGYFYRPQGKSKAPAIVMSHGFSAVKEMGLELFAARFAAAGFAVLLFDYRFLGASEGAERGRIVPQEQHDDIRAALEWISGRESVDANRIGLWGTSYSGGHALFIGALDPRVKAIVAQAPAIQVAHSLIHLAGREGFDGYLGLLADDRARRNAGAPSARIPIVAAEGISLFPTPDAYSWFTHHATKTWEATTTFESVARMAEYAPAVLIDLIAPKPLLVIAGQRDTLIPIAQVRAAFARAGEPKSLIEHDCGHFGFYPGEACHDQAASDAVDWFSRRLRA